MMKGSLKKYLPALDLYIMAIVLAACSIVYELILANTLSMISNKYIVWYSLTIGCFIAGLGLGSTRVKDEPEPYTKLIKIELFLALLGGLSVAFIYTLRASYEIIEFFIHLKENFDWASEYQVGNRMTLNVIYYDFSLGLAFLIGFFSGYEVPLLLKCVEKRLKNQSPHREQTYEHLVLGFNYFGTLVGTVLYSYFLFPNFGFVRSATVVAILNLLICFYLFVRQLTHKKLLLVPSLVLFSLVSLIFVKSERIEQNYLKLTYFYERMAMQDFRTLKDVVTGLDEFADIERFRTLYQFIDINYFDSRDHGKVGFLSLNTNFQFSTKGEETYHEAFSHLPFRWLNQIPEKVLVLGGGDGLLIRELIKYDEIESIHQIELDAKMIDLAKNHPFLTDLNQHPYRDPRVSVKIGDAFQLSRQMKEKYDAIFIDFPFPRNMDLMRLYSVEFYKSLRKNLSQNGFIVLDGPVYGKIETKEKIVVGDADPEYRKRTTSVLMSTGYFAGFKGLMPYTIDVHSFLIMRPTEIPKAEPHYPPTHVDSINYRQIREALTQEFDYEIDRENINSIFSPKF